MRRKSFCPRSKYLSEYLFNILGYLYGANLLPTTGRRGPGKHYFFRACLAMRRHVCAGGYVSFPFIRPWLSFMFVFHNYYGELLVIVIHTITGDHS